MKTRYLFALAALVAAPAVAQQGDPLEAANAIDACNGAAIVSAAWQDDGRLAVTCPRGSLSGATAGAGAAAGAAAAAGGATGFALPAILALVVGAAAVGGGGSTSGTN